VAAKRAGSHLLPLRAAGKLCTPTQTLSVLEDEPDNRILECAAEATSAFIVTEDRDLLRLQRFGDAQIVTAAEILRILRGDAVGQ
jgi:predicted nucleic acid-binding protein